MPRPVRKHPCLWMNLGVGLCPYPQHQRGWSRGRQERLAS